MTDLSKISELDVPAHPAGASPANPAVSVDWTLYEHHLADADLTDEQKREFLSALWYIVMTFVDLGFGIEPVQQAIMAGEAIAPAKLPTADDSRQLAEGFRSATGKTKRSPEEGDTP